MPPFKQGDGFPITNAVQRHHEVNYIAISITAEAVIALIRIDHEGTRRSTPREARAAGSHPAASQGRKRLQSGIAGGAAMTVANVTPLDRAVEFKASPAFAAMPDMDVLRGGRREAVPRRPHRHEEP